MYKLFDAKINIKNYEQFVKLYKFLGHSNKNYSKSTPASDGLYPFILYMVNEKITTSYMDSVPETSLKTYSVNGYINLCKCYPISYQTTPMSKVRPYSGCHDDYSLLLKIIGGLPFNLGSAIKYIWESRCNNDIAALEDAILYLKREIERRPEIKDD